MKQATYVVTHDSLYLRGAGGKLQLMKRGDTLNMTQDAAASLVAKGFIQKVKGKSSD